MRPRLRPDRSGVIGEASKPASTAWSVPERDRRVGNILRDDVITSMVIGMVPFPLLDTALLAGLQVKMVSDLCAEYGVPFSRERAVAVIAALVGSLPVVSILGIGGMVKGVPVLGSLIGGAAVSVVSGAVTYAQGRVLARHFESGGTLLDIEPRRWRERLRREYRRGSAFAVRLAESGAIDARRGARHPKAVGARRLR